MELATEIAEEVAADLGLTPRRRRIAKRLVQLLCRIGRKSKCRSSCCADVECDCDAREPSPPPPYNITSV